jgi:SsrA-binding protein
MPILLNNKKATFDYHILEKMEAGLVLSGQEVKSLREKKGSLAGAYITVKNNGAYLVSCNIPAYQPKNASQSYNPKGKRKLLLHKKQIAYLFGKSKEKGLAIIPLKIYTKNRLIKLEIGVAQGKKKYDKREKIKKREIDRDLRRKIRQG